LNDVWREAINAAHRLDDLLVPPSNRLEKLKEKFEGIFINSDRQSVARYF